VRGILLSGGISAIFAFFATPGLIRLLAKKGYGQIIRDDGPTSHHVKRGTPTMGGLALIAAMLVGYFVSHLITGIATTTSALLVIGLVVGLGIVGFIDYCKRHFNQACISSSNTLGNSYGFRN